MYLNVFHKKILVLSYVSVCVYGIQDVDRGSRRKEVQRHGNLKMF